MDKICGLKEIARGFPAQNGAAIGIARIAKGQSCGMEFNQGDILVAQFTSPLLMVFIRKAGAIITNSGGMLSHAAIIARESGIPCIVGAGNVTELIKPGQKIMVNADEGVIYEV